MLCEVISYIVNVLISNLVLKHHALGNQASVAVAVADALSELTA